MYRSRLYRFVLPLLGAFVALFQAALALAGGGATGTVDSSLGLNLRAGPGLGYRVLTVLSDNQALELVGRSANNQWLEARLPDNNLGGWVYAAYVQTSADLSALTVTEAAGGPADDRPPAALAYPLYVVIADNVATVHLQKYPAQATVMVKLGPAGSSPDLLVAQGQTGASGSVQISFAMPATWADGRAVTERNLVLSAATADGRLTHRASIVYIK